jgi:hypothetical protein
MRFLRPSYQAMQKVRRHVTATSGNDLYPVLSCCLQIGPWLNYLSGDIVQEASIHAFDTFSSVITTSFASLFPSVTEIRGILFAATSTMP